MSEAENVASNVAHHPAERPQGARASASVWHSFVAAVQFLTRLPIAGNHSLSSQTLQRSPIFYPLVGALIGTMTASLVAVGCLVWPIWLAVLVALAIEMRLTGALHEDAVADFCDAFGGGWTRDQVLTILKDSRIGTYGALGLLVAVSLRGAATIVIINHHGVTNPWIWGSAMVASSMIGRWLMVLGMVCLPPVPGRESLAREVGSQLKGHDLLFAGLWAIPFAVLFAYYQPWQCAASIVLLIPTAGWFLLYVKRKLGGITGDCLGCLGYISQVVVLLAAAMNPTPWSKLS